MDIKTTSADFNSLLIEAGFSSTLRELETPTQEYIVRMFLHFLSSIDIDTDLVQQPTAYQCQTVSAEDLNTIRVWNIYGVMRNICSKLFINELDITDITSPTPKRTKKILRFLINFILYKNSKMKEIQDRIDVIRSKKEELDDIMKKQNNIQDNIIRITQHDTQQSALPQQYRQDIQHLKSQLKTKSEKLLKLEHSCTEVDKEKHEISQRLMTLKTEIAKINKVIEEDQIEVISSPERYKSRLKELEEECARTEKPRQEMNQNIQHENKMIERSEKLLSFLKSQLAKLNELSILMEQCKQKELESINLDKKKDSHTKMLDEIIDKVETCEKDLTQLRKSNHNDEIQHTLTELRKLQSHLFKKFKKLNKEIEGFKIRDKKTKFNVDTIQDTIKKHEREIENFIKGCQDMYDSEIQREKHLQDIWYEK